MRNIIIIGSSRSGTSLAASLFSKHYYQGEELLPPTISNPKGYYEDRNINLLNNKIIYQVLKWSILNRLRKRLSFTFNSDPRAYPMAAPLWIGKKNVINNEIKSRIKSFTEKNPFCYKDPRFNVTLPFWAPFLPKDIGLICVFRDSYRTADSQLRNAREVYSPPIPITLKECNVSWYRNYKRILYTYSNKWECLFIHYDMIITQKAIPAIENFAGVKVDTSKIDKKMSRSKPKKTTNAHLKSKLQNLYERLQQRAIIDIDHWSSITMRN